jgi:hypothetical protein
MNKYWNAEQYMQQDVREDCADQHFTDSTLVVREWSTTRSNHFTLEKELQMSIWWSQGPL